MKRLLLSLFLALPVFAATDLGLQIQTYSRDTGQDPGTRLPIRAAVAYRVQLVRTGEPPAGPVTIDIDVPGTLERVSVVGEDDVTCTGTHPVHCVARTAPAAVFEIALIETRLTTPGTATLSARIVSPADAFPQNDTATRSIEVVDSPSLIASAGFAKRRVEPGEQAQFTAFVSNDGATATNVVFTTTLTSGGTITGIVPRDTNPAASCALTAATVTCTIPSMPYGTLFGVDVHYTAPDRLDGTPFRAEVRATSNEDDFDEANDAFAFELPMVRHIVVTNTDDEGAGSLRQALLEASALCATSPCTIDFRIPGPGPFVIRPRTQLPDVTGIVKVDGRTQTVFGGDTNPGAPEIEIDGSLQPAGNGLVLREGCEIQVLGLKLGGFVNSALEARRGKPDVQACRDLFEVLYPSTLVSQNVLTNSNRGLVVMDNDTITIVNNFMTNNRRSGLFAQRASYLAIRANDIEGNGASGIFLDVGTREYWAGGADVEDNVIAHNAHWGVARTRSGEISLLRNAIFGNSYQAIDVDLDFDTPNRGDDTNQPPNKPVLVSATYDAAANRTVVRGSVESSNVIGGHFTLQFFASTSLSAWGQPEAEMLVASQDMPLGEFTVTLDGDLRGKYITATNTRTHIIGLAKPPKVSSQSHLYAIPADTSEISNAVRVQ